MRDDEFFLKISLVVSLIRIYNWEFKYLLTFFFFESIDRSIFSDNDDNNLNELSCFVFPSQ